MVQIRVKQGKNTDTYSKEIIIKPVTLIHQVYNLLLYSYTFTQQNEHCDWLILGHVPLIKFKCIPTGIQLRSCCPHAVFVCLFLLYESLNI